MENHLSLEIHALCSRDGFHSKLPTFHLQVPPSDPFSWQSRDNCSSNISSMHSFKVASTKYIQVIPSTSKWTTSNTCLSSSVQNMLLTFLFSTEVDWIDFFEHRGYLITNYIQITTSSRTYGHLSSRPTSTANSTALPSHLHPVPVLEESVPRIRSMAGWRIPIEIPIEMELFNGKIIHKWIKMDINGGFPAIPAFFARGNSSSVKIEEDDSWSPLRCAAKGQEDQELRAFPQRLHQVTTLKWGEAHDMGTQRDSPKRMIYDIYIHLWWTIWLKMG